jgi:hypothetical protein
MRYPGVKRARRVGLSQEHCQVVMRITTTGDLPRVVLGNIAIGKLYANFNQINRRRRVPDSHGIGGGCL